MEFLTKKPKLIIRIKLFIYVFIFFGLTNCSIIKYDFALIEVSGTDNYMIYNSLSYADSIIAISFIIKEKEIGFGLKNQSPNTLKLIWDETLFIINEITGKVMHSGIKFIDRNMFQPASVVPKGTIHNDIIVPTENVYWRKGKYGRDYSIEDGWEQRELFPQIVSKTHQDKIINNLKGSEFTIYMPIQVKGVTHEYNFKFKIVNVSDSKNYVPIKYSNPSNKTADVKVSKDQINNLVVRLTTEVVKDIDGNKYPISQIGLKFWMSDNLRVKRFNNGDIITEIINDNKWSETNKSAWSIYDNSLKYGQLLGNLYNGNAITDERNICPVGWHVPTDSDWEDAIKTLGGAKEASVKMKSIKGWLTGMNGSDLTGMNCLPGGSRNEIGEFYGAGKIGVWWSSTNDPSGLKLYTRTLTNDEQDVVKFLPIQKLVLM